MVQYNNPTRLHPFVAAMLAYNDYDYNDDPTIISTTSLMKPTNMVALERFNKDCMKQVDVEALIPSVMGSAMHSLLEVALETTKPEVWKQFGMDAQYLEIEQEIRKECPILNYKLSGKFDVLYRYKGSPWRLGDLKTLAVWGAVFGNDDKTLEYVKQLSIYRWLNQDKEIEDIAEIYFWYTDWSKVRALQDSSYPQSRVGSKEIALWSLEETELFIKQRLLDLTKATKSLETTGKTGFICEDKDLWRSEDKYKYYKPNKSGKINYTRATKVFDDNESAMAFMAAQGNIGEVIKYPGQVKRCNYCSVRDFCTQYPGFVAAGLIAT